MRNKRIHQELKQRTALVLFWFILLLAFSHLPVAAQDTTVKRSTATFSFTTSDPNSSTGSPLVQVQFGNGTSASFLLDTGTNPSLISEALVKRLNLKPLPFLPGGKAFLGIDGKPTQFVTVDHFNMEDLHIEKQKLIVVNGKTISSGVRHPIDGIIGIDMLAAFTVFFDFPNHHAVIWTPGGFSAAEIAASVFKNAVAVPLKFVPETALFSVPVELKNGTKTVSIDLTLDTGANLTSMPFSIAQQLSLHTNQQYDASSFYGIFKMNTALCDFRMGDLSLNFQQINYPAQDGTKFPSSLGMDILFSRLVLMDFPQKKMYTVLP